MSVIRRIIVFAALCLVQALVLNRIQLFGCATPLLYVYFVIMFPRHYPRWAILLWSFFLGLSVDMFSNTLGVTSASLTLVGFTQSYLIELFLPRDAEDDIRSSAATLGWGNFVPLAMLLTLLHCLLFFAIETFSFFHWLHWLECVGGSTVLTLLMILAIESLRK
ncbi:MAG: rod shape-determining protein MreD [Prevotella sp.]|nr:rod shape-determining protein MreD [Prevotella sp.]